jgi:hypothetical protein
MLDPSLTDVLKLVLHGFFDNKEKNIISSDCIERLLSWAVQAEEANMTREIR